MNSESEIQAEIESLKERFTETKALYREVCALLFFRHGITPTASKLYQYVRKGSMSAPAEALARFWEELRNKARVQIDHPDLPEALKVAAADAVQTIWGQATELARTELAALRVEAQAQTAKALADLQAEQDHAKASEGLVQDMCGRLAELETQLQSSNAAHEGERRAHAATTARTEALQHQVGELQAQQERIRADFSAELDKGRTAIEAANERAAGAERRALREIELERTERAAAEKQLDGVRGRLMETERQSQSKALEFATATTRMSAELEAAKALVQSLTASLDAQSQQLQDARQQSSQFKAEADTLRSLVEQFKPGTASKAARAKRGNS
ncbi:DNA-binding protein [Hydrogenophaga sp.]|jgi:chromosome segregation ATPase|uniref:DNA-binding protein n=1 Tax=Hydrogenophaga sp. TaxID=1904254 RepID=UPI003AF67373